MKEKVNMRHAVTIHLRGIKELHKVSSGFFPVLTLHCIVSAITPYITVFFSAQILKELGGYFVEFLNTTQMRSNGVVHICFFFHSQNSFPS